MGGCITKPKTVQSARNLSSKNKFHSSSQEKLTVDNNGENSNSNRNITRPPRNMVLPTSKVFDVNYTTIPNKIHKQMSTWDNQIFGLVGLSNLGNTCFMNSALQCLLNTVPLVDYFLSDLHEQEVNAENFLGSKGIVTSAFANLAKQVWGSNQMEAISPRQFYSVFSDFAPQFSYGTQEDSHDFLAILLDVIHEDLNRVKSRPTISDSEPQGKNLQEQAANAWKNHLMRNRSIIVDLFQSQIKSSLKCHECGFVSYKFEPYMYLSLPVPEDTKKDLTLYDCLNEFIKEEKLDKEERWHCPKCKEPKDSSKKIEIWNVPNILIIHLKRFKFTRHKRGKIRSVVDFPVADLDLSSYLEHPQKDKPVYALFAVSCHEGTLTGGHYTSYVKNRDTGSWHFFNDSYVKDMDSESSQVDASGYVLFYSKTSVDSFARQTISDPTTWPHFSSSRRPSASGMIHSHKETPMRSNTRKTSMKKNAQKLQSRDTLADPFESGHNLAVRTPRGALQKKQVSREYGNNLQMDSIEDLQTGPDADNGEFVLKKKKSKPKQAVLVVPKTTGKPSEPNQIFKSPINKTLSITGIEIKSRQDVYYRNTSRQTTLVSPKDDVLIEKDEYQNYGQNEYDRSNSRKISHGNNVQFKMNRRLDGY